MGRLREEVFYLAWHLHWSWSEAMGLPIGERRTFVSMVAARVEEESRAVEAISRGRR